MNGLLNPQNLSWDVSHILLFYVSHAYPVHLSYPQFHLPISLVSGELATKSYKRVKITPIPNPLMDAPILNLLSGKSWAYYLLDGCLEGDMMNNEGNHFEPKEEETLSAVTKEQGYKKLSLTPKQLEKATVKPLAIKNGKLLFDKSNKDHRYIVEEE
ncbi:hypothetical protein SDC9_05065 [bioreactor metagenome]|nr:MULTISPECIES: hypothetical protein [Desulfitobacterium]MEA5022388.1 hypothetical protein [Desulfitobacterium hafniense]